MDLQCVILAAGKGKRLHPVTLNCSKAMAPIAGKPIVERVMETFAAAGVTRFLLVTSPDDNAIVSHFRSNAPRHWTVGFVEQSERLGMAHALKLARPFIDGHFLLSACDSIVSEEHVRELLQSHATLENSATLSLMEVAEEFLSRTGVVELRGDRIVRLIEKPAPGTAPSNIASLPLYVFSSAILPLLDEVQLSARGEYELQDAIQLLIGAGHSVRGLLTEYRVQLTSCPDLLDLNMRYLEKECLSEADVIDYRRRGIEVALPSWISSHADVQPGAVIGPGACINENSRICRGARVRRAVILAGGIVGENETIEDRIVYWRDGVPAVR